MSPKPANSSASPVAKPLLSLADPLDAQSVDEPVIHVLPAGISLRHLRLRTTVSSSTQTAFACALALVQRDESPGALKQLWLVLGLFFACFVGLTSVVSRPGHSTGLVVGG